MHLKLRDEQLKTITQAAATATGHLPVAPAHILLSRAHTQPRWLARIQAALLSAEPKPRRPELLHQLLPGLQETPCGPA